MNFPRLPLRSLQARIFALCLLLVVIVQAGGFLLIKTAGLTAARRSVGAEIVAGARVFDRFLRQDTEHLVQGARLLTADYAFREAVATGDRDTLASVLANHGKRIDATLTMLVGLDKSVIANSAGNASGERFEFAELVDKAEASQQSPAMVVLGGQLYQFVVVPVLAPLPVAWLAAGFEVNDALAQDLHRLTRLQVSFLTRRDGGTWRVQASTLEMTDRANLLADMAAGRLSRPDDDGNADGAEDAVSRVVELSTGPSGHVVAVLQEPLAVALEPFWQLQRQLTLISLLGILVSIVASIGIARGIGRPVRDLSDVARRIAAGDYSTSALAPRNDEIGDLAVAFRAMQDGIITRESRITDLAYRDALTGLPNRARFAEELDRALVRATDGRTPAAVLLMDLDHFKYVNDTLGHPIGDLLLREVAARLSAVMRRPDATVARLGGDEYGVLLPGATAEDARRAGDAILRVLETPMTIDGHVVDIRASIGIATYPDHGTESSQLLRRADVAMYEAKRSNRGIVVWDVHYDQHSLERLSLMSDLRKAIDNAELSLVYQPKVSLHASSDQHVEALLRWKHPVRGMVPPSEFIPFAEQTGFIRVITQWVMGRAVAQCAAWRRRGMPIHVSINLSARDLSDAELPERFESMLAREECSARWFAFEITESAILDDPGHAIRNLERLHALGCKLAIDDYGTGYSSLAYLRRLPVQEIKIDKSFVMGLARDASDAIIVRSTIDLGHNMGLVVVAEGVEDQPTFDQLRALGCDMVQGYLLSAPLAAGEVEDWMREFARTHSAPERKALRRVW